MWTTGNPALHYRIDGSGGSDILLLHELGGSLHSWDAVVALADPGLRLVRFDQRGFGLSEKPRAPYDLVALCADAQQVLAAAGVDGPFAIAAAAGASPVAIALAGALPHRVTGLVLCSPALEMSDAARALTRDRAARVSAEGMRGLVDQAMDRMFPPPTVTAGYAAYRQRFLANDPVGFALANLALAAMEPALAAVACPVTILAGRHDIRPPEEIAQAARSLGTARLRIVEHGGHVLPVQAPDAVAAALTGIGRPA